MGDIITSDLVPIEIRGNYQSYINIMYGLGSSLGVATGGEIADFIGWRWGFGMRVPALAISLYLATVTVPTNLGLKDGAKGGFVKNMKKFDYMGSLLLITSIICLILGLVSTPIKVNKIYSSDYRVSEDMSTCGHTG
jgi:MFS family permease